MPAGFDGNGMPVGLQLVGRPFSEGLLLRAAHAFEREAGISVRRPPGLDGSELRRGGCRPPRPELRGILLTLIAMLLFGYMDGISKFLVSHYPAPMVLWLRHVAAVPAAFLIFAGRNPLRLIRVRRLRCRSSVRPCWRSR